MLRNRPRLTIACVIAMLMLTAALPASAQLPPGEPPDSTSGIFARVVTDKFAYAPDEPIEIAVHAINATQNSVTLEFRSGCHAAYRIDDVYNSINHVGCTLLVTYVTLAPGEDRILGQFTHTSDDYRLTPGPHVITGEILGHARAQTRIMVQGTATNRFAMNGWAEPRVADVGEPVGFHITVTNSGDSTATFVVDGCPVHYTIDGVYTPMWACAEFARQITLAPGESISFDPENDPQLLHDPAQYPLSPGPHVATLFIREVGRLQVPFEVRAVDPNVAALAGRVIGELDGQMLDGVAILSYSTNDSILTASNAPEYGTPIGPEGWFLFGSVSPGRYYLRVEVGSVWDATGQAIRQVVWYPGVTDPAQALPIDLAPGVYRDDVMLKLPGSEPPPPPETFPIDGFVFEVSAIPEGVPLSGALVVAVPVIYTLTDTGSVPPDKGEDGSGDGSWPPFPGVPSRILAYTGPDGSFHMDAPPGTYRLIAGRGGAHRYQYWNHAALIADATLIQVPDLTMTMVARLAIRFDLLPVDATAQAMIAGTVLAMDPTNDGPPQPLADAEVVATPILPDMTANAIGYRAVTDADGKYALRLPPDTPYVLSVYKEGYGLQFFGGAFRADGTQWVDVAPGATTSGIDFILYPFVGPGPNGAIEGWVYRGDVRCADGDPNGERCLVPAAGAVVRISAAYPTFAPYELRTIVGPDGHFYVDGITASEDGSLAYYVSAELENSAPAYYPGGVPYDQAVPLSVFPGMPVDAGRIFVGRVVTPPDDGFVFGSIVDPSGAPIPGALVHAFVDPESPYGPVFAVMTDAEGHFFVQGLPAGVPVLVSAEAEGFVPAYYPNVHKWEASQRVWTGGPAIDPAPLTMTLRAALSGGPFIQAGRVRVAVGDSTGPGGGEDSTSVGGGNGGDTDGGAGTDPGTGAGMASASVRSLVMAWHRENLRGAFFYLVNALSESPVELPVAGGSSGDNGTLVLTGLLAGIYNVYADRPGYAPASFSIEVDGSPTLIRLDANTAAVLADIRLKPLGGTTPPVDDERDAGMVSYLGNAPNPFRPQTTIGYRLEQDCPVTLRVFDYQGRLVRTLASAELSTAGPHEKIWDGRDERGRRVSAGVYFYRITAENQETARRMVLLP